MLGCWPCQCLGERELCSLGFGALQLLEPFEKVLKAEERWPCLAEGPWPCQLYVAL